MSARARAALGERDANHAELARRYSEHFCQVLDLSTLGGGVGDTLVRINTRSGHVLQLVEIKTEDGSLNSAQELFHRTWGKDCIIVAKTIHDVDAHISRVKARFL